MGQGRSSAAGGGDAGQKGEEAALALGDAFDDKFSFARGRDGRRVVLGKGAIGDVLLCRLVSSEDTFAAAKIIPAENVSRSVEQGIRCLTELSGGPGIITLLDPPFRSPMYTALVFEHASGGELFEFVRGVQQLSEDASVRGVRQVIRAVSFLHGAGYVHRDLKPENILLFPEKSAPGDSDEGWTWKITDFDFAKDVDQEDRCSTLCGTPGWSPPEIMSLRERGSISSASGENMYAGRAVDVWGVGMIAYYCLGGYRAFEHQESGESSDDVALEFHEERWGKVSERVRQFCRETLARNYLQRIHWKKLKTIL